MYVPFNRLYENISLKKEVPMDATLALLVIAVVYAVGDFVSSKTRAVLSMLLVAGLLFLFGFWLGVPKTLFDDAQVFVFALAIIPMLIVHMGTLLNIKELKEEWKTVVIALGAIIAVAVVLYLAGAPLIGKEFAVSAAAPITGGVVATLIMQEVLGKMGLDTIVVFATLLLVLQSFIGLPVASFCLSREARRLLSAYRSQDADGGTSSGPNTYRPKWRIVPEMPQALQSPFILLMKAMLVGWLAVSFAHLLGDVINKYIMALLFGIIFSELGFLEAKILDKANAAGLSFFVLLVPVFSSLPKATPHIVASLIVPIVIAFFISVIAIVAVTFLLSGIFKYSWALSMALGMSCMFGFPGTFIISEEIAAAQSESEEEREFLLAAILPKMLVAGFTTVTIASVFIAGIMVKFL